MRWLAVRHAGYYSRAMPDEFTIIPSIDAIPDWFTLLQNGKPVLHGTREACERYAIDPAYRESIKVTKFHDMKRL
jgi:hypothetical protein